MFSSGIRLPWFTNACVWILFLKAYYQYKYLPPINKHIQMESHSLQRKWRELNFKWLELKCCTITISGKKLWSGKNGKGEGNWKLSAESLNVGFQTLKTFYSIKTDNLTFFILLQLHEMKILCVPQWPQFY